MYKYMCYLEWKRREKFVINFLSECILPEFWLCIHFPNHMQHTLVTVMKNCNNFQVMQTFLTSLARLGCIEWGKSLLLMISETLTMFRMCKRIMFCFELAFNTWNVVIDTELHGELDDPFFFVLFVVVNASFSFNARLVHNNRLFLQTHIQLLKAAQKRW